MRFDWILDSPFGGKGLKLGAVMLREKTPKTPSISGKKLSLITLPPIIMEVENSPFAHKPHIFQDPIFH